MDISRVTNVQQTESMIGYISDKSVQYQKLLIESSSGIKVNEASDDPTAAKKILNYTTQINSLTGYKANITAAKNELNVTTSTLDSLNDLVSKAADYATQAANGTYTQKDLSGIKSAVDSIIDSIVSSSNTTYEGKFIFSGQATSTQTYTATKDASGNFTAITYNGSAAGNTQRYSTVSDGTTITTNVDGQSVFGHYTSATDKSGLFGDLVTLSNALAIGDTTTISSTMDSLSTDLTTINTSNTKLSATYNQINMTSNTITDAITTLKGYKSDIQNADLSETLTQLESTKTALEASYTLTSQVMNMSLLNYMR